MISHAHALDRKIKQSNIEEIFERLCMTTTDLSFTEVLAEFGIEIRNNLLFEPYIKNIADKENEYRQRPDIASILQKATYTPTGHQVLDQKMLTRRERVDEYFSLWSILRFSELYDISSHEQVRAELVTKNDLRDLANFEAGVTVISNILEGNSNANLADSYLPHTHRVMSGIIQFFDKQQSISIQYSDSCSKNKVKASNQPLKLNVTVKKSPDEKSILLSTDGKEDIRLMLFKKDKPSEQTNQIKVYFEVIKGSICKYTLNKDLKLSDKQIEKAYRSINELVKKSWGIFEYLTYSKRSSKYSINSSYPTKFSSL